MNVEPLEGAYSVCRVADFAGLDAIGGMVFTARTDAERSLVCETARVPPNTLAREDGWRGFRVAGVLDFSLVGILARISSALAAARIGLFAVSTYDTDYIFVKAADFPRALELAAAC